MQRLERLSDALPASAFGCPPNALQPFSQKSHTPTVAKEFQIGLYDPTEADLEHFWNCCSEGFLGERLYVALTPAKLGVAHNLNVVGHVRSVNFV